MSTNLAGEGLRFYIWHQGGGRVGATWRVPACQPNQSIDATELDDSEFEALVEKINHEGSRQFDPKTTE